MPQVHYYPVLSPLGFYEIIEVVEEDAPAAPVLPVIPLPEVDFEVHNDWLPWNNGFHVSANRRFGLLTPPKTPLPLHLEDIQEQLYIMEPIPDLFEHVPDGQNVLETPNIHIWAEEGSVDEAIFGPLEPMNIDDDGTQEPGIVGFDGYEEHQQFHAILDEYEDGEEDEVDTDEEEDHPGLMIDHRFFEYDEGSEDESGSDDGMDLDEEMMTPEEIFWRGGGKKQ